MQHRKLYYDDSRGMGEALNEKDASGKGIVVSATYFLQIFENSME
jgi:hypothetical protein